MTRKDTILIAVIINAGLLSILFTTAVIYDTDKEIVQTEFVAQAEKKDSIENQSELIAVASTGDEVDNVLNYYHSTPNQIESVQTASDYRPEPIAVQTNLIEEEEQEEMTPVEKFVEIRVKKGDVLDKIARANGTTTAALKRFNHLQNEKLSIGQVIRIPLNTTAISSNETKKSAVDDKKETDVDGAVYYVIKSGDNPWKIAKQFQVSTDDIIRLNHLDEGKARNLKIGDRVRVK